MSQPTLTPRHFNHWGGLGRWAFLEVTHMENAADLISSTFLRTRVDANAP